MTQGERRLLSIFALLCAALLVPSLTATDPMRALQEWLKLLIMCTITIMLCRALRHPPTAKVFGASLLLASIAIGMLIIATYLKYIGLVLPTYATTRAVKGAILQSGIPLNALGFECVFAFICAMCLLGNTRLRWAIGFVLLLICSVLTGSRAPFAVLILSILVLIALNALRSRHPLVSVAGGILAAAMLMGPAIALSISDSKQMSAVTEGRWDLWSSAFQRFTERPLLGYGYMSCEDDPLCIPGGYHSEYLTALAEQGIVGFIAVLAVFWFLLRCCLKLAFQPANTWQSGQWALFGCLFLLLRATVELPGLFGTAQAPADFLAYIFLAIVVSRISREEDYFMSETPRLARSAAHPFSSHPFSRRLHAP